jgi:hypothetical protein
MKQETLEEAAEKYANKIWDFSDSNEKTLHNNCKKAFLKGAKWQAERMYSEEDLEVAYFEGQFGRYSFNDWFEQFKKK